MKLAAHGLAADLPAGWEGSITVEDERPAGRDRSLRTQGQSAQGSPAQSNVAVGTPPAAVVAPVAQFATFALPATRDDFGGDAVERMGPDDVFVSLLEYGAEEVDSALFSDVGLPRRLDARAFSPKMLHRQLRGHAGLQLFFHERGRAFCLYIVLGNAQDVHRLTRRAEQVLSTIEIEDHS